MLPKGRHALVVIPVRTLAALQLVKHQRRLIQGVNKVGEDRIATTPVHPLLAVSDDLGDGASVLKYRQCRVRRCRALPAQHVDEVAQ